MIEINLLPGGGRKKASTSQSSVDFGALAGKVAAKLAGPNVFIAISVVIVLAALSGVGFMYWKQMQWRAETQARLDKAAADSTRFASAVEARDRLVAKRDTILWQANLIRNIDGDRFIWPHILDEVSKVLPQYTWITNIEPVSAQQGGAGFVALVPPPKAPPAVQPDSAAIKKAAQEGKTLPFVKAKPPKGPPVPVNIPPDVIEVRIVGMTADLEALTAFMRDLTDSPFISDVTIVNTTVVTVEGKDAYSYTLKMKYERPDSTAIRRTPIAVTAR